MTIKQLKDEAWQLTWQDAIFLWTLKAEALLE